MRLGAFLYPAGHHAAAWRAPGTPANATTNLCHLSGFARTAERAKFDLLFVADGVAVLTDNLDALKRTDQWAVGYEPFTLLSALGRDRPDRAGCDRLDLVQRTVQPGPQVRL